MSNAIERRLAKLEVAHPADRPLADLSDEELQGRLNTSLKRAIGKPDATRDELDAAADEIWRQYQEGKLQ